MKKYRYEYVRIDTGLFFLVPSEDNQHREIIDEYAAKGWRYVGFVPAMQSGEGRIRQYDLVFEQEVE
ncbi:MAG: DUF4177 domain-containing protein [Oscillospiraceae bacterium]|nr:DUF4177 domain-containing protein [Oscillospiraceae bacterium]